MDRLTSLTAFVRVVDSGGFSAAGRKLNMSTTMVSNHVQSLEDRLGARLLHRTTRKVSLTEVGKTYYDRATQILADLEQADDIAGAMQSIAARHAAHLHRHPYRSVVGTGGGRISRLLSRGQGRPDHRRTDHRFDRRGIRSRDPADAAAGLQPDRPQPRDLAARAVLLARLSRTHRPPEQLAELCAAQLHSPCALSLWRRVALHRPQGHAGLGAGFRQSDLQQRRDVATGRAAGRRHFASPRDFWLQTTSKPAT